MSNKREKPFDVKATNHPQSLDVPSSAGVRRGIGGQKGDAPAMSRLLLTAIVVAACAHDDSLLTPDMTGVGTPDTASVGSVGASCVATEPTADTVKLRVRFIVIERSTRPTIREVVRLRPLSSPEFSVGVSCGDRSPGWTGVSWRGDDIASWLPGSNCAPNVICGSIVSNRNIGTAEMIVSESGRKIHSVMVYANGLPYNSRGPCDGNNCRKIMMSPGGSADIDLREYIVDPDGDALRFFPPESTHEELSVTISGDTIATVRSLGPELYGAVGVAVQDGFEPDRTVITLAPIQVGCPGLAEIPAHQRTGFTRESFQPELDAMLAPCDRLMMDRAFGYFDRAFANDSRQAGIYVGFCGPYRSITSAGGSGPTDDPTGSVCMGEAFFTLHAPTFMYETFRHEVLHALGIGSGQEWYARIRNKFTWDYGSPPPDTHFVGERAYRAFVELGGKDFYQSAGVPVANGSPSNVQANSHWRSEIIDNEIMVGCDDVYAHYTEGAECAVIAPVSAITLGALADMGWIVDMNMAEWGTRVGCFRSCRD